MQQFRSASPLRRLSEPESVESMRRAPQDRHPIANWQSPQPQFGPYDRATLAIFCDVKSVCITYMPEPLKIEIGEGAVFDRIQRQRRSPATCNYRFRYASKSL